MKKIIKFVCNFQKKEEILHTKSPSLFQSIGWFVGRTVRNVLILSLFVATGYVSAKTYNSLHPIIVQAAPVVNTVEVPKNATLADYPILVKICNAESGSKQFLSNGNVVRGKVDPSDIGICQLNEPTWNDQARKLGYDIFTEKGNEDMAIWIFVNHGTDPWNASKANWK